VESNLPGQGHVPAEGSIRSARERFTAQFLPQFSLEGYAHLISWLRAGGYEFAPVSLMQSDPARRTVYLRHDVDLHLLYVDRMAQLEDHLGVTATYYVALTQPYNILSPCNRDILKTLVTLGHEVGLHYDVTTYPTDATEALRHLKHEVAVLEWAIAAPVRSICMHQPHVGHLDPFLTGSDWLNPHDPSLEKERLYISDSCRAWRDTSLLLCRGEVPPHRVMLNTHPELWLDSNVSDRERYLDTVVMKNALEQTKRYLDQTVRTVWRTHDAPRAHDARLAAAQDQCHEARRAS
jgi:hypothetical protein